MLILDKGFLKEPEATVRLSMGSLEQLAKACLDVGQIIEEIRKTANEGSTRKALCEELGEQAGRLMCAQQHLVRGHERPIATVKGERKSSSKERDPANAMTGPLTTVLDFSFGNRPMRTSWKELIIRCPLGYTYGYTSGQHLTVLYQFMQSGNMCGFEFVSSQKPLIPEEVDWLGVDGHFTHHVVDGEWIPVLNFAKEKP